MSNLGCPRMPCCVACGAPRPLVDLLMAGNKHTLVELDRFLDTLSARVSNGALFVLLDACRVPGESFNDFSSWNQTSRSVSILHSDLHSCSSTF